MRQPTTLHELGVLTKHSDADGLRALLQEGPEPLALLGLPSHNLQAFLALPDPNLVVAVRRKVERLRTRRQEKNAAEARAVVDTAVRALIEQAHFEEERVVLNVALLLGPVLADRTAQHIVFQLHEHEIAIRRDLLRRASSALKGFTDVVAFIAPTGLHLRWRNSRGGLNLRPQSLSPKEQQGAVHVILKKPASLQDELVAPEPPSLVQTRTRAHRASISGWLAAAVEEVMPI